MPAMGAFYSVNAGENDALFLHDHRGLGEGVTGHADHAERVVAHVQPHLVLEGDHRRIGPVALQQGRLLGPEGGHARHVLLHVGAEDA